MTNKDELFRRFDDLESQRKLILTRLEIIPKPRLEIPPDSGGWSVAQVIAHLAIMEERTLAYLKKKHAGGQHRAVTCSSYFRLFVLNTALASPFKFKAPSVVADVPKLKFDEATVRWEKVREEMRTAYSLLPEEHVDHEFFKHPALGRFTVAQSLRFMYAHHRRHSGQIERILSSAA